MRGLARFTITYIFSYYLSTFSRPNTPNLEPPVPGRAAGNPAIRESFSSLEREVEIDSMKRLAILIPL